MTTLIWAVLPYATLLTFAFGVMWRHRRDERIRTRQPYQRYRSAVLRAGSPMFHIGIVVVLLGHLGGLLVPKAWTEAIGIDEHTYHLVAVSLGIAAGVLALVGLVVLIGRRRSIGPAFAATTRNDKAMYAVLAVAVGLGLLATVRANVVGAGYDYRDSAGPWLRSVLTLRPRADLMADAPIALQAHVLAALALVAFWPFTRLVHVWRVLSGG